jgi:hypothetical protein
MIIHLMLINTFVFILLILLSHSAWGRAISPSSDANCTVEHNGQRLCEGDSVDMKGKLYKVEDCVLHRAYHACGTHLLYIINIVCQAIKEENSIPKHRYRRFSRRKLLTEACCEKLCTVSEMTRYCPQ